MVRVVSESTIKRKVYLGGQTHSTWPNAPLQILVLRTTKFDHFLFQIKNLILEKIEESHLGRIQSKLASHSKGKNQVVTYDLYKISS